MLILLKYFIFPLDMAGFLEESLGFPITSRTKEVLEWYRAGDGKTAKALSEELCPDDLNPIELLALGQMYRDLQGYTKATELYEKALSKADTGTQQGAVLERIIWSELGYCHKKFAEKLSHLGESDAARQSYELARHHMNCAQGLMSAQLAAANLINLIDVLIELGKNQEALKMCLHLSSEQYSPIITQLGYKDQLDGLMARTLEGIKGGEA